MRRCTLVVSLLVDPMATGDRQNDTRRSQNTKGARASKLFIKHKGRMPTRVTINKQMSRVMMIPAILNSDRKVSARIME
jgi:hypothetical protein